MMSSFFFLDKSNSIIAAADLVSPCSRFAKRSWGFETKRTREKPPDRFTDYDEGNQCLQVDAGVEVGLKEQVQC